jgi:hypothetical protein
MNRKRWMTMVLGGVGAWLWMRRRQTPAPRVASRGTVIFDNTPKPSGTALTF